MSGPTVVAVGARGAGQRFGVSGAPVTLSAKARALGLRTRQDVEREYAAARDGHSRGTDYHCPFCDADMWSWSGASKHMREKRHPVLRWDWYEAPRRGVEP